MSKLISRRGFINGASAATAAAFIGAPYVARGATTTLTTGTLAGGWTHICNGLLLEKDFGAPYGIKFEIFNTYNSVRQYYADIVTGNFDIGVGAWDFFAKVYAQDAPTRLAGICTNGSLAGYFSGPDGPSSLSELKGKTLAAMEVSGTYLMGRTFAKVFDGIDFLSDLTVQNGPNPPAVITLVAAGRADAALGWEHTLSAGLLKVPGSKVFLNLNDYYRSHTDRDMPYFCIADNQDRMNRHPPDALERAISAYSDMFDWIDSHPEEFASRARTVDLEPAVIKRAVESGRMKFKMRSMAEDKNREDVLFCANILHEAGSLPKMIDEGFFTT